MRGGPRGLASRAFVGAVYEGCVVTVLPAGISLRPVLAELGISVANIVLAEDDEGLKSAFGALGTALHEAEISFEKTAENLEKIEACLPGLSGQEVQEVLEVLGEFERYQVGLINSYDDALGSSKFQHVLSHAPEDFSIDDFFFLFDQWRHTYIPLARRVRLSAIMLVFRRAQERGVESAQLDAGFVEWFLAATREETESWQETAHLLAVPESADRLLRSIRMSSQDRTDQMIGSIG